MNVSQLIYKPMAPLTSMKSNWSITVDWDFLSRGRAHLMKTKGNPWRVISGDPGTENRVQAQEALCLPNTRLCISGVGFYTQHMSSLDWSPLLPQGRSAYLSLSTSCDSFLLLISTLIHTIPEAFGTSQVVSSARTMGSLKEGTVIIILMASSTRPKCLLKTGTLHTVTSFSNSLGFIKWLILQNSPMLNQWLWPFLSILQNEGC